MSFNQNVGNQSIGVQFSGDRNTVTIVAGAASLALARPQTRKAEPKTELELLRVDIRATTLVGRTAELAVLDTWLADDRAISFRCLVARAGTGKTRLGVELCERAETAGWTAGFIQNGPFQAFVPHAADWRWTKNTLVVVDYAASFARDLRAWLEILAAGQYPQAPKLRVLLFERHADAELGWFADLLRVTSFSAPSPADLADPPLPVPLASLGKLEDRRALLAETMRRAAARKADAPQPPAPGADAEFDRRLADDAIDNEPLYLMMAGAEAVQSGAPAALRLTRTDLAARAAARERARLERLAKEGGLPPALLTHLALCVTLQGGCDPEAAEALLHEEVEALSLPSPLAPVETIQKLAEAMPASAAREIDALRPDLVGEAFVLAAMRDYRGFPAKETAIVSRTWRRAPEKVVATLVRTAQDFARGDPAHESVRWLDALVDGIRELGNVFAFVAAMPHETLALREVAASASRRAVELSGALEQGPDAMPALGFALTSLAFRLSAVGQREAALEAGREAARIDRELAAQRPDAFRPNLALSLNDLANMLSYVGQREAALDATREAVDIRRDLAAQRPDAFRPDLARSLNNLAAMLSEVGQCEAALDAAREAANVCRGLAAHRPDAFRPDLAMSLNTLAVTLSYVGQREAALDAAREAVDIRRDLAAQRTDAFRPDLAMSLSNLANMLSQIGQREAALDAAREAADVDRELATQRPDAFRPDLARSLNNLANMLSEVGQREAALDAAREATDVYRDLAAQWPDTFRPNLALSLNNFSDTLREVGQREAALDAAREAVDIRRDLAAQRPDAFRPDLAMSLINLAPALSHVGQRVAALEAAREAADLYRALAAQRPDAFRPNLALSLNNLARVLSQVGQREAALDAAREAADLCRALAVQRPDAFRPYLAMSLSNLADTLGKVGQREAALDAAHEAADLYRALAVQRPDTFRPYLALSLINLAETLSEVGQREAALDAALESIGIRRELAAQRPDAFRPDLAMSLDVLAKCLSASNSPIEAQANSAEAVETLAAHFFARPLAFADRMNAMVRDHMAYCKAAGQEPDAAFLDPIIEKLNELSGDKP